MTLVTKATRGAVGTNNWTNPANAVSDNGVYATAGPGKNATILGDWDWAAFSDVELPVGATINSVIIRSQYKVNVTSSVAHLHVQAGNNGAFDAVEEEQTEPTADLDFDVTYNTPPTETDLKTAGRLVARIGAHRGNSNNAVTFSLDYVELRVDYSTTTISPAQGDASATSTATSTGAKTAAAQGLGPGSSTAPATGAATAAASGSGLATTAALAVGASTAAASGTGAASSTAIAVGLEIATAGAGAATATSTATGVGASTAAATGTASADSSATATSESVGQPATPSGPATFSVTRADLDIINLYRKVQYGAPRYPGSRQTFVDGKWVADDAGLEEVGGPPKREDVPFEPPKPWTPDVEGRELETQPAPVGREGLRVRVPKARPPAPKPSRKTTARRERRQNDDDEAMTALLGAIGRYWG